MGLNNYNILLLFFIPFLFIFTTYEVSAEIEFIDVSKNAKLDHLGQSWSSAWTDFDNDGFQDLLIVNHGWGSDLFLNNRNGSFTNISDVMEDIRSQDPHGSAWADFDNDGDKDLIILKGAWEGTGERPNKFFVNENGILIDKALEYGLEYSHARGRHPLWFDFDNDGLLDIMLFNAPRKDDKGSTAIFLQAENGFVDITKDSGITMKESAQLGQVGNIHGNLPMELIFMGPRKSGVYELSDMPFKDIRSEINVPHTYTSDITIADFNGDLLNDIFVTRFKHTPNGTVAESSKDDSLYINSGGMFIDKTSVSGIKNPTSCHSSGLGDFDNDMDVDIYLVCTRMAWNNLPNLLYENLGNGTFTIVPDAGGAGGIEFGLGDAVSITDYNNDGFLDLHVTNGYGTGMTVNDGLNQLFQNQGNDYHWLEIDLEGTKSNRDAIGSSIFVTSGDVTQIREQTNGSHFHSQDFQRIHFGLKEFNNVDKILVFWPSGMISELYNIESNQILKIVEPIEALSPYHQIQLGIIAQDVVCNNSLELIIKSSDGKPACVKSSSLPSLIERGWIN